MERLDFDLLCAALAFTALTMKGEGKMPDSAARAAGLAHLIKEFCELTVPEAFDDDTIMPRAVGADLSPNGKFGTAQRMANVVVNLLRKNNDCAPRDLIEEGFTSDEIERCWPMARALAQAELNMMDS